MKLYIKILCIIISGFFCKPVLLSGQSQEFVVKAVFLERFTHFIEWPENFYTKDSTENFIIGIFRRNPLHGNIEELYKCQQIRIKNKKVEYKYFKNVNELEPVHLLLIPSSKKLLPKILNYTRNRPILTISDNDGFGAKGVLINFFIETGKVRFEINELAVYETGLSMSYLLFEAAKIVNKRMD
ncbi:YfiR family protein [bacterium]|nr:YfiR family protein [bacterium]